MYSCAYMQRRFFKLLSSSQSRPVGFFRRLVVFMTAVLLTVLSRLVVTPSTPWRVHHMLGDVVQVHQSHQPSRPQVQCCKEPCCPHIVLHLNVFFDQVGCGGACSPSFSAVFSVDALVSFVHDQILQPPLYHSGCRTLLLECPLYELL